jgi:hypothetical protein
MPQLPKIGEKRILFVIRNSRTEPMGAITVNAAPVLLGDHRDLCTLDSTSADPEPRLAVKASGMPLLHFR